MLTTECAALSFVHKLTEPADLSLRWRLRHYIPEELGGTRSAVIVRAHMAGVAQGNEVIERIVAGESERIHVMSVEFPTIIIRAHTASAANAIARAHLSFDCFPIASVIKRVPTTPIAIPFATQIPGVIRSGCATSRAVFPTAPFVSRDHYDRVALRARERLRRNGRTPPIVATFVTETPLLSRKQRAAHLAGHFMIVRVCSDTHV